MNLDHVEAEIAFAKKRDRFVEMPLEDAEALVRIARERNALADALRRIGDQARTDGELYAAQSCRAALDRHTPDATDEQIDRSFDAYR